MDDPSVLLISVCAISAVIAFFMALLLLLRVARFSVFGFANLIIRMLVTPKEEPTAVSAHAADDITLDELKARAHALDFDAAVEQLQRRQDDLPTQPPEDRPAV